MQHYLDLQLRADPEFPAQQLMDALYAKLHRALVELGNERLAVTFPKMVATGARRGLGDRLRVIGPEADLSALQALPWLQGMRDHVEQTAMAPVPTGAQLGRLVRVQAKSGVDRMRRRAMRRHGLTEAQAQERLPDAAAERLDLPHLSLRSASTGQQYLLFLRFEAAAAPVSGVFNTFGLGAAATVPWF